VRVSEPPSEFITQLERSERGVRKAPDLLPEDYMGGEHDQGSIGM
jgi:hypothetical protein